MRGKPRTDLDERKLGALREEKNRPMTYDLTIVRECGLEGYGESMHSKTNNTIVSSPGGGWINCVRKG